MDLAMSDPLAALRGTAPEPAPQHTEPTPSKPRKNAPAPAPAAPDGPSDAELKTAQLAEIRAAADELAGIWQQVGKGAVCPGPQATAEDVDETSPEYVARLWIARFAREDWITHLFGCPTRAKAGVDEHGVSILAEIGPGGLPAATVIAKFQAAAEAAGFGRYEGGLANSVGPRGEVRIVLWRTIVGTDPATPWRAAGRAATHFYEDRPDARAAILYTAGLGIDKPAKAVPTVRNLALGERGPEITIRPLPGQDAELLARACEGKLRGIFECPSLSATASGVDILIALNTKPEATFPVETPLSPTLLHQPRNRAEAMLAAQSGLVIPVGLDRNGRPVLIKIQERPHLLITGTSGAGKSTTLRLMLRALQLQGCATLILADGKGADMRSVYAAGIGQNLSVENASIHRAIGFVYDELLRRKEVFKMLIARKLPETFPVLVLCIDEFGAWAGRGLSTGASKADRAGVEASMARIRYICRQGRSLGVHVILSTQDVTVESGINAALLAVVNARIIVGRPEGGPGGSLTKLFNDAERPRVAAATEHITPGAKGLGVMVDEFGEITAFKAFFNAGAAAETFDAALAVSPRQRRFAWEFPNDSGAWLSRTAWPGDSTTGPLETVDTIPVIALDNPDGTPIHGREMYDEGSPLHDPGAPPLNAAHRTF
jgi:DNA segregation ATPase FtsK/SpoIIIE, S-DNA-T family